MAVDRRLEKRVCLAVPVYVASAKEPGAGEKTLTENISLHGARVVTKRRWHLGEQSLITPLTAEFRRRSATVIYFERMANGCFGVGLELGDTRSPGG